MRQKLPGGRYELPEPHHSWNTNHIYSNLVSFHLQRHSDHHANSLRPYQALRDFADLPRLPSGYPELRPRRDSLGVVQGNGSEADAMGWRRYHESQRRSEAATKKLYAKYGQGKIPRRNTG